MFPVVPLMGITFLNLLGLPECAFHCHTLMLEIKVKQPNFYSMAIDIINYESPLQNFIADTMN